MSKVMVVAGGIWQVPLIQKAKELGHFVINTNLYKDSPGFEFADAGIVADVLDKKENLKIAREYSPDAIITDQSDIAVPTVAYLCEKLGLKGIGVEKAELFTNKHLMREFCRLNHFPQPEYKLCTTFKEVKTFSEKIGFPVILKPTHNQASRGVNKVDHAEQIEKKYNNSLQYCVESRVLVERYVEGTEFTVEGFIYSGKHFSLAVSKKSPLSHNPAIARNLLYSHKDNEYNYDVLRELNNSLVEKMQLPFGITHAEYKYLEGKFYLIEVAARGGGSKISSHIVPMMSGVDTNQFLINISLGNDIGTISPEPRNICSVLEFLIFNNGKVKNITGLNEIKSFENVVDAGLTFDIGDVIAPPIDDSKRHGYFIAYEKDEVSLNRLCEKIKNTIKIEI